MRLVIIDNYDSFTYNLFQLFSTFDIEVVVIRNDAISIDDLEKLRFDRICISPGPKAPKDSGISMEVVRRFYKDIPILGVCLGMQVINEVFGGKTDLAPYPVHGKRDLIFHTGKRIFKGIPSPFFAARYHSLQCKPTAPQFQVLAKSSDNVVMGIAHPKFPVFGVQFHPESYMSEYGKEIINNFLELKDERLFS